MSRDAGEQPENRPGALAAACGTGLIFSEASVGVVDRHPWLPRLDSDQAEEAAMRVSREDDRVPGPRNTISETNARVNTQTRPMPTAFRR